jgi:large subunit ribosomal protein L24
VKIKKDDTVKILSGKDKGKTGKVLKVLQAENKVVVEKINIVKKHKKQTGDQKDFEGIIEVEAPISIGKVMVVCGGCGKPARVKYKVGKTGKKRICAKCGGDL